jgi:hypothetical protein
MAAKTKRPTKQETRREGKELAGWIKLGVYLSPEAAQRLMLASLKRGRDRSTILNALVLAQLPAYAITVEDRANSRGQVITDDRLESAGDINSAEATAA